MSGTFLFREVAESKPESDENLKVGPPSIPISIQCPCRKVPQRTFGPGKKIKKPVNRTHSCGIGRL